MGNTNANEPTIDLRDTAGSMHAGRAAEYEAWAERLKAKRQRSKARIAEAQGTAATHDSPSYWSTDALFTESERVASEEQTTRPTAQTVADLLAVLDLPDDADAATITNAYRQLAKAHHPDRFVSADPVTQAEHAERMLAVNRAYRQLRELSLT